MKNTLTARPGFFGNLKQKHSAPNIQPAPSGESVYIRFPKDIATLDELDVWLNDHPHAQVVVISALPYARSLQTKLMRIAASHSVGILIKAPMIEKEGHQ